LDPSLIVLKEKNMSDRNQRALDPTDATQKTSAPEMEEERESVRRNLKGPVAIVFGALAAGMSLYHLFTSSFWMPPQFQHRAVHLALALALIYLLYPGTLKRRGEKAVAWYDLAAVFLSLGIGAFLVLDYMNIVFRAGDPTTLDIVLGSLTIVLVLEATRRTMGWPLVIVAVAFLAYAIWGHLIPGTLGHRPYSFKRIIEHMFLTAEGIYGVSIYVTATYVFIFISLGAFLTETGGGKSFIDLAFAITGRYRGGPAKAAVVASGLMGTISGSSFANVAGTGVFTIPLMKSVGYKPTFAGGVEAAASTGGQIMPPVMGAAAFIMAEMTGVSYGQIIICAAIPAVLYYVSVFLMVDMEAAKIGLRGLSKEKLPDLKQVLKDGAFLLIAPFSILYMLIAGYSPIKASVVAVGFVIFASFLSPKTRLTPKKFYAALVSGAKASLSIVAACAVAGIIVGVVTLTGCGLKFADLVLALARGSLYPALILTMVACIVMSMGMPTTALYIILGAMVAPGLVKLNLNVVAAHMFIFYYGCMAAVTPPVALSSYLAASIAGADPTRTAFQGLKLALSAFILPFIFVLDPSLLLIDTAPGHATLIFLTALLGITALAAALEGYLMRPLQAWQRITLAIAALVLIVPGIVTDLVGAVLFVAVLGFVAMQNKKEKRLKE
jgi:TRAP transporter 4TM/12TM fusion protein